MFENDFAAVLPGPAPTAPSVPHPLLQTEPVAGGCDVLCFHPRHDLTLARLELSDIEHVINEWVSIYLRRGKQEGIKYVQIFEASRFWPQILRHTLTCSPTSEQRCYHGLLEPAPARTDLVVERDPDAPCN